MDYEEKKDLEVPSFMQNNVRSRRISSEEREQQFQKAKASSVNSKPVRSKKGKKRHISTSQRIARDVAFLGLGVFATLSVTAIANKDKITDFFEEKRIVCEDQRDFRNRIIDPARNTVRNGDGSPKYDTNGGVMHWYDTLEIGNSMKNEMKNGVSPEIVVYNTYCTMVTCPDDVDDFYNAMRHAGLNDKENEWALENGYSSMQDKHFEQDARRMIVREYNSSQYEMNSMFNETEDTNIEENTKGGK